MQRPETKEKEGEGGKEEHKRVWDSRGVVGEIWEALSSLNMVRHCTLDSFYTYDPECYAMLNVGQNGAKVMGQMWSGPTRHCLSIK